MTGQDEGYPCCEHCGGDCFGRYIGHTVSCLDCKPKDAA